MKKKRVNLKERFPKYYGASKRTETFAELSEADEEVLQNIEDKLDELQEEIEELKEKQEEEEEEEENTDPSAAEEEEEEEEEEEQPKSKAKNKAAAGSDPKLAALEAKLAKLEKLISNKPAADGTVIDSDEGSEGRKKAPVKKYATSVDAEMERLFKKK